MGHDHGHAHGGHSHGGHSHLPAGSTSNRRIWPMAVAVAIIGGYFVVELVTGIAVDSLALIADAGHMLTDVVALVMGLIALLLARHGRATDKRSFGWHRAEVFTAVANAALLIGVAVFVLYEAIERLGSDPQVPGLVLIVIASIGLLVNLAVMLLLRADAQESIAVRGAYMEVLADALGSIGVLIAGVIAMTTGWGYADIVVAVLIALWVVPRAVRLAIDALRILNQQAPQHIDVDALRAELADLPQVVDVHDLHVWSLTTGMDVATVHLSSGLSNGEVLTAAKAVLDGYGLEHATIQVDPLGADAKCRDEIRW